MESKLEFNSEKVNNVYEKLVQTFQEAKLTTGELLIAFGNLGYTLGASIEGYSDKGPSIEELKKKYYEGATVGVALMLQSYHIVEWFDQYQEEAKKTNK